MTMNPRWVTTKYVSSAAINAVAQPILEFYHATGQQLATSREAFRNGTVAIVSLLSTAIAPQVRMVDETYVIGP